MPLVFIKVLLEIGQRFFLGVAVSSHLPPIDDGSIPRNQRKVSNARRIGILLHQPDWIISQFPVALEERGQILEKGYELKLPHS